MGSPRQSPEISWIDDLLNEKEDQNPYEDTSWIDDLIGEDKDRNDGLWSEEGSQDISQNLSGECPQADTVLSDIDPQCQHNASLRDTSASHAQSTVAESVSHDLSAQNRHKQILAEFEKEDVISKEEMEQHESAFLNGKHSIQKYMGWLIRVLRTQDENSILDVHYEFIERFVEKLNSNFQASQENNKIYYTFLLKLLSRKNHRLILRLKKYVLAYLNYLSEHQQDSSLDKTKFCDYVFHIVSRGHLHFFKKSENVEYLTSVFNILKEVAGRRTAQETDKKKYLRFVKCINSNSTSTIKKQEEYITGVKQIIIDLKAKAERKNASKKDKQAYISFVISILQKRHIELNKLPELIEATKSIFPTLKKSTKEYINFVKAILNTDLADQPEFMEATKSILANLKLSATKSNATKKAKDTYLNFVRAILYSSADIKEEPECVDAVKSIFTILKKATEEPGVTEIDKKQFIDLVKILFLKHSKLTRWPECIEAAKSILITLKIAAEKINATAIDKKIYIDFAKVLIFSYSYFSNQPEFIEIAKSILITLKKAAEKTNARKEYIGFLKKIICCRDVLANEPECIDAAKSIIEILKIETEKPDATEADMEVYISFIQSILSNAYPFVNQPEFIEHTKSILAILKVEEDVFEKNVEPYIRFVKAIVYSHYTDEPEYQEAINYLINYLSTKAKSTNANDNDKINFVNFIKCLISQQQKINNKSDYRDAIQFTFDFFKEKAERINASKKDKNNYYTFVKTITSEYSAIVKQEKYLTSIMKMLNSLKETAEKNDASQKEKIKYISFLKAILRSNSSKLKNQPESIEAIKYLIRYLQETDIRAYQRYLLTLCSHRNMCSNSSELVPFIEEHLLYHKEKIEKEENVNEDEKQFYQKLLLNIIDWPPNKILNLSSNMSEIVQKEKEKLFSIAIDLLPAPEITASTPTLIIQDQVLFKFITKLNILGIKNIVKTNNEFEYRIIFNEPDGKKEYVTWWNEGKKFPQSTIKRKRKNSQPKKHKKRKIHRKKNRHKAKTTDKTQPKSKRQRMTPLPEQEANIGDKQIDPEIEQLRTKTNEQAKRLRLLMETHSIGEEPPLPEKNLGKTLTGRTFKKFMYEWSCSNNVAIVQTLTAKPNQTASYIRKRFEETELIGSCNEMLSKYIDAAHCNNEIVVFFKQQPPSGHTLEWYLRYIGFDPAKQEERDEEDFKKVLSRICKLGYYYPLFYINAYLMPDEQTVVFVSDMLNPEDMRMMIESRKKLCINHYDLTHLSALVLDTLNDGVSAQINQPSPSEVTLSTCLSDLTIRINELPLSFIFDELPVEDRIAPLSSPEHEFTLESEMLQNQPQQEVNVGTKRLFSEIEQPKTKTNEQTKRLRLFIESSHPIGEKEQNQLKEVENPTAGSSQTPSISLLTSRFFARPTSPLSPTPPVLLNSSSQKNAPPLSEEKTQDEYVPPANLP